MYSADTQEHKRIATKRIVLVGQPNVGKSVLFHALTGTYVAVSNYPGTTVDVTRGIGSIAGNWMEFWDSPGIYSLVARSDEEKVTRTLLMDRPDIVIQVADAKNLARSLTLTLELGELQLPMVLVLNMKDEALSRGYQTNVLALSRRFGIPIVETTATTREGIEELVFAISQAKPPAIKTDFPKEVRRVIEALGCELPEPVRILAPLLLSNHTAPGDLGVFSGQLDDQALKRLKDWQGKFVRPVFEVMMQARLEQAAILVAETQGAGAPGSGGV